MIPYAATAQPHGLFSAPRGGYSFLLDSHRCDEEGRDGAKFEVEHCAWMLRESSLGDLASIPPQNLSSPFVASIRFFDSAILGPHLRRNPKNRSNEALLPSAWLEKLANMPHKASS